MHSERCAADGSTDPTRWARHRGPVDRPSIKRDDRGMNIPHRRGGPVSQLIVDIVRYSIVTRSWVLVLLLGLGALAALMGLAIQTAVPWAIYPFV